MLGVLLLTLGLSVSSFADTYQLTRPDVAADTGDFAFLSDRIANTSYANLEDFLKDWKSQRPVYFSNYVMAYRSRSLQQATPQSPRVILFNRNTDLVMSFNGHGEFRGSQQIEMMRFNHDKDSFEFYEMNFKNNRAELSAANPAKCLECHQGSQRLGVDPRPNWEPYNAWLGFYGSIDDSTKLRKNSFLRENVRDDEYALISNELESEEEWYAYFWEHIQPQSQRYQLLDPVTLTYMHESTINGDLTNRLTVINYRRVARLMTEQTDVFDFVKYTLWANSRCDNNFFVSDDVYAWLKENTPHPEVTDGEIIITPPPLYCYNFDGERACEPAKPYLPHLKVRTSTAINLLFETFFVKTEDWSMDFKTQGRFAAFERFGLANDPRPAIRHGFERYFFRNDDFRDLDCDQLQAKSLENFGSIEKVKAFWEQRKQAQPNLANSRPLIQRCISCHVNDGGLGGIPAIPFDNPAQLKILLHSGSYKRGTLLEEITYRTGAHAQQDEQMPPRGIPTAEQRNELIRYLQEL